MTSPLSAYRLAITDLDETLLGPDKQVSAENRAALETLRAAGLTVVPASGRHHDNIVICAKDIHPLEWVISSQGAVVRHAQTNETLYALTMTAELANEIQRRGLDLGLDMIAYHASGVYKELDGEWSKLSGVHAGTTNHLVPFETLSSTGVIKLIWYSKPDHIEALRAQLHEEYRGRLYIVKTEDDALEFLSPEANKVRGAQAVAAKLGIPPTEVIAFGDSNNDMELLAWAGMSVAMHHGRDALKKVARHVSPPGPRESALARAVELLAGSALPASG